MNSPEELAKENARVIYSLCIEDLQTVAQEEYGRRLSKEELEILEEEIGDFIQWYDAIDEAIRFHLGLTPQHKVD